MGARGYGQNVTASRTAQDARTRRNDPHGRIAPARFRPGRPRSAGSPDRAADRHPARRGPGHRLVLALHLRDPVVVLRDAADPRPDGDLGWPREPALAVHRHARRHDRAQRAVRLSGEAPAAHPFHPDHLSVLHRQHPSLRAGAQPRRQANRRSGSGAASSSGCPSSTSSSCRSSGRRSSTCSRPSRASGCSASSRPARRSVPSPGRPRPRSSPTTCRPGVFSWGRRSCSRWRCSA